MNCIVMKDERAGLGHPQYTSNTSKTYSRLASRNTRVGVCVPIQGQTNLFHVPFYAVNGSIRCRLIAVHQGHLDLKRRRNHGQTRTIRIIITIIILIVVGIDYDIGGQLFAQRCQGGGILWLYSNMALVVVVVVVTTVAAFVVMFVLGPTGAAFQYAFVGRILFLLRGNGLRLAAAARQWHDDVLMAADYTYYRYGRRKLCSLAGSMVNG